MNKINQKLLIVTGIYPPDIGGPASYLPKVVDYMSARGVDVKIFTYGEYENITCSNKKTICRKKNIFIREMQSLLILYKMARNVDCIYTNGNYFKSFIVSKLLKKRNVLKIVGDPAWERAKNWKIVTTTVDEFNLENGILLNLFKFIRNIPVKYSSHIITPSDYLNKMVKSWVPSIKITTIYNGVILEKKIKKYVFNNSKIKILVIARLVKWKNIDTIISIIEKSRNIELDIIGDGPEKNYLSSIVSNLNISHLVHFHGHITDHNVIKNFFNNAHCLVLNSDYEGLSHVLLESMLYQCPVICSNIDGNREVINNGTNGLLFEVNNKEQILKSIYEINNLNLREKLVNNAYQDVKDKFNLNKNLSKVYELLFDF